MNGSSRGSFSNGYLTFAALISLYAIVIVPLTVFRLYREEFAASFLEVAGYLVGAGVAGFVTLAAFLRVVPESVRGWVARALLFVVVLGWYNFNFLDYQRKIVGLDADVFEGRYALYEYALFLAVGIGISGARNLNKHLVTIMALVCAGGTIGLALESGGQRVRTGQHKVLPEELYAYSQESNVLHVVLDGMQSVFLQELIDAQPEEKDRLDGFWYFPNTLASSDVTYLSFQSFYTARPFRGEGRISDYMAQSGPSRDEPTTATPPGLLAALRDHGFDLDLLSAGSNGLTKDLGYRTFVLDDVPNSPTVDKDLSKVLDYSLLRAMPWSVKRLVHQNGTLLFSSWGSKSRAHNAAELLNSYASRVTTSNPRKTYKLLHLMTPHGPWTSGSSCEEGPARSSPEAIRDQGRCALRALVGMIQAVRTETFYDRSLIVVHGDHGICVPDGRPAPGENTPDCIGNANPLLLIKPFDSRGALRESNRATALTDIPATIASYLGVDAAFEGERLLPGTDSGERERAYYTFEPDRVRAWRLDRVETIHKYTVRGDVHDPRAWRHEVFTGPAPD